MPARELDIVLSDCRIVDGCGNPWYRGDVGVRGGRIRRIAPPGTLKAARMLNVDGRFVAPGFVDPHTHSDLTILTYPRADSALRQGVTTHVIGNCGMSAAPVVDGRLDDLRQLWDFYGFVDSAITWPWRSFGDYLLAVQSARPSINVAALVGHGALRVAALGFAPRTATARAWMRQPTREKFWMAFLGERVPPPLDRGRRGLPPPPPVPAGAPLPEELPGRDPVRGPDPDLPLRPELEGRRPGDPGRGADRPRRPPDHAGRRAVPALDIGEGILALEPFPKGFILAATCECSGEVEEIFAKGTEKRDVAKIRSTFDDMNRFVAWHRERIDASSSPTPPAGPSGSRRSGSPGARARRSIGWWRSMPLIPVLPAASSRRAGTRSGRPSTAGD